MSIRAIKNHLEGGFRPFTIFLSDGRKYNVPHPEFIMLGRTSIAVLAKDGEIDTLNPLHVVSVKDFKPDRRRGNGR